jgi:hypothetical protein
MAVDKSHIYLSDVYGSQISDNYLNDAYNHNSGSDYAILLEFRASENLIQNNIIRKARHTFPVSGSSGNVLAYNYALDAYMGEYHNSLPETQNHAAHPYMNLWEGNVFSNIEFDFTHGSGGYNTVFRNYVNLTSTNPDTGAPMSGAIFAIAVAYYNNYDNILGNAIGQYPSGCTATSYQISANSSQSPSIYKLGYYDDGGTKIRSFAAEIGIARPTRWYGIPTFPAAAWFPVISHSRLCPILFISPQSPIGLP